MAQYKLVVMSSPKPGQEEEYNRWYNEVHLREMTEVKGFIGAKRYRVRPVQPPQDLRGTEFIDVGLEYLAIYEVETDDLDALLQNLYSRLDSMDLSDTIGQRIFNQFYEPV